MWNRLKRLHHLNGYATLFLFISGILLFIPSLRGPLASYRVMLKDVHIWISFATVAFLLLYVRYFAFHYKVIKKTTWEEAESCDGYWIDHWLDH